MKSLKSDRRVDPNIIDSAQSSYLKVNNELITKYNKQREFVSLAAHELRSPILPILGTLELIEYEFEESGKKEITLKIEHFERLVRNVKRLERLASEILDLTGKTFFLVGTTTCYCLHLLLLWLFQLFFVFRLLSLRQHWLCP
jgi:hypothetical protein